MKYITFFLAVAFMLTLASAQTYELNQELDLTVICFSNGYCSAGAVCNTTVFYPNNSILLNNVGMTNNGHYFNYTISEGQLNAVGEYVVRGFCEDAGNSQEIDFNFDVTPNGELLNLTSGAVQAFLLIFFVFLMWAYYMIKRQVNFESWIKKIQNKYEGRNTARAVFSSIGYVFIKDSFMVYFLLLFPVIFLLINMVNLFNVGTIEMLNDVFTILWLVGLAVASVFNLGRLQEFIADRMEEANKIGWGIRD